MFNVKKVKETLLKVVIFEAGLRVEISEWSETVGLHGGSGARATSQRQAMSTTNVLSERADEFLYRNS